MVVPNCFDASLDVLILGSLQPMTALSYTLSSLNVVSNALEKFSFLPVAEKQSEIDLGLRYMCTSAVR